MYYNQSAKLESRLIIMRYIEEIDREEKLHIQTIVMTVLQKIIL